MSNSKLEKLPDSITSYEDELHERMEVVLKEAKMLGADGAEAAMSIGNGLSVSVRMGKVETVEHNRDKGLAITVYFGQRKGSASTTDFAPLAVKQTVAAACSIAKYTAEDEYSGLPDAQFICHNIPDLNLYFPWNLPAEKAIDIAELCERHALQTDVKITNSEGSSVSTQQGMKILGNSLGFLGSYPSSRHVISCSVIAEHESSMQRDYWFSVARKHDDLSPPETIGQQAAHRALGRLQARRIKTCQCPVIFSADVASSLISSFIGAIKGSSQYRSMSFLLDCLDKQIFPKHVHIYEKPHIKSGLGSAPFDAEGVSTHAHDIVEGGYVRNYVLDTYSAKRLNMTTTGNAGGVHNLIVDSGTLDFNQMLKTMDKGLLITELMGQGVNRVTGDYSRGVAGFWIENGEVQYPVEEITVAGNLKDMYQGIVEIGRDVDLRKNIQTGSILIENMTIAGE